MDYLVIHLAPVSGEEETTGNAWDGIRTTYIDTQF